jgi:hypothetical protein
MKKFPVTGRKIAVTGRKFLSQEQNSVAGTKFLSYEQNCVKGKKFLPQLEYLHFRKEIPVIIGRKYCFAYSLLVSISDTNRHNKQIQTADKILKKAMNNYWKETTEILAFYKGAKSRVINRLLKVV